MSTTLDTDTPTDTAATEAFVGRVLTDTAAAATVALAALCLLYTSDAADE